MRIKRLEQSTNFQRKFSNSEKKEAELLHREAQKLLNLEGGKILIVHDTSLPFNQKKDLGTGFLNSKLGFQFFDDIKAYLGFNKIELHPQGEYHIRNVNSFCCPYAGSGMSLGAHIINPQLLTTVEYGNLLKKSEITEIIKTNKAPDKNTITNFENIIPENSSFEKTLKKAFERFKTLSTTNTLKQEYTQFVSKNNDWLEPQGIYKALKSDYKTLSKDWNELDRNLFNEDFDITKRNKRIIELKSTKADDIYFFKFKQFMADKILKDAKKQLNEKGLELIGDCHIGWGDQDIFTNPKAFFKNISIGWGLPALNYDKILDPNSDASKLLQRKVELCAQRYDGIRFDVGWAYLSPRLYDLKTKKVEHRELDTDEIIKQIEHTVKKVKGISYDLRKLIYEFEASPEDFQLNSLNKDFIRQRTKIYSMQYMNEDWGHLAAFKNLFLTNDNTLIMGLGNQDGVPHRNIATMQPVELNKLKEEELLELLVNTFGGDIESLKKKPEYKQQLINKYNRLISLKSTQAEFLAIKYHTTAKDLLDNPKEFAKFKAVEAFNSKNNMLYFMDMFGSNKVFDAHSLNGNKNYRYRIPQNYLKQYVDSVIEGFGINMFEIYEKLLKEKGLDSTYPELFQKVQNFKNILLAPEEIPIYKKTSVIVAGSTIGLGIILLGLKFLTTNKKETTNNNSLFNKNI